MVEGCWSGLGWRLGLGDRPRRQMRPDAHQLPGRTARGEGLRLARTGPARATARSRPQSAGVITGGSIPQDQPPNVEVALQYASRLGWAVGADAPKRSSTPATVFASPHVIPTSSSNGDEPKASAWPAASPPAPTCLILTTQKLSQRPVSIFDALVASALAATMPSLRRHLFFEFPGPRSRVFPWGEWQ